MNATELKQLIFSPYHTSKIVKYFLSGVQSNREEGIKYELIFLVLPIIYNRVIQKGLTTLNKTSKLTPFINKLEIQKEILNINSIISNYKKVTKQSLIMLNHTDKLYINEFIKTSNQQHYNQESTHEIRDIYKASYNLGIILSKETYLNTILQLRLTSL